MLYYRYRVLWRTFFAELDMETVVSAPTDREILEQGTALAIDEACLSLKIYLGHAAALMGKCDYILAPRVSSLGRHRSFCTRFESMPDLVRNVFRASGQKLLTYEVDEGMQRKDEESAFLEMGRSLGCPAKAVKRAYRLAKKADAAAWKERVQKHEQRYKTEGMKVLIAAHSYVAEDPYMGRPVTDYLKQAGVIPVRADIVDRDAALKHSRELSPTCGIQLRLQVYCGTGAGLQIRDAPGADQAHHGAGHQVQPGLRLHPLQDYAGQHDRIPGGRGGHPAHDPRAVPPGVLRGAAGADFAGPGLPV